MERCNNGNNEEVNCPAHFIPNICSDCISGSCCKPLSEDHTTYTIMDIYREISYIASEDELYSHVEEHRKVENDEENSPIQNDYKLESLNDQNIRFEFAKGPNYDSVVKEIEEHIETQVQNDLTNNYYDEFEEDEQLTEGELVRRLLSYASSPRADEPLDVIFETSDEEDHAENTPGKDVTQENARKLNFNKANSLVWEIENCFMETEYLLTSKDKENSSVGSPGADSTYFSYNDLCDHDYVNISDCTSYDHDYVNISDCYTYSSSKETIDDYCNVNRDSYNKNNISSSYNTSIILPSEKEIEELFYECFRLCSSEPNISIESCLKNLQNLFYQLKIAKRHVLKEMATGDDTNEICGDLLFNEVLCLLKNKKFATINSLIEKSLKKREREEKIQKIEKTKFNEKKITQNEKTEPTNENMHPISHEETLELYKENQELQESLLSILNSLHDIHDNFLRKRKKEIDMYHKNNSDLQSKLLSTTTELPKAISMNDIDAINAISAISEELKSLKAQQSGDSISLKSVNSSQSIDDENSDSPTNRIKNFIIKMKEDNIMCYEMALNFLRKLAQSYTKEIDNNTQYSIDEGASSDRGR